jgi:hypothetical protein
MFFHSYVRHVDPLTGTSYYINRYTKEIRFDKPVLLGPHHDILTPRTALQDCRERRALRRRQEWVKATFSSPQELALLQTRASLRAAAFYVYDIL